MPDPRQTDAAYRPFPSFSEWAGLPVAHAKWARYSKQIRALRDNPSERLTRAFQVAKRAAALDTGALEGLYEVNVGFTLTVAQETAMWEAALAEKGENAAALFAAQLDAYDAVMSLATQEVPVADAWIRELHVQLCRAQDTYRVLTPVGWQEQALPKGQYKHCPNHVLEADGKTLRHAYAPVDRTPAEMHRLCTELQGQAFQAAHPILQASYAHYALTAVHPFADGNGRVARALASVYTYRAASVPVLILSDSRDQYLDVLRAADAGEHEPFVEFILDSSIAAIQLVRESITTADAPDVDQTREAIRKLYTGPRGLTHLELDQAAPRLLDLFTTALKERVQPLASDTGLQVGFETLSGDRPALTAGYRVPRRSPGVLLRVSTIPPAERTVERAFLVEIPLTVESDADLAIVSKGDSARFDARVDEFLPVPIAAFRMRLRIAVEGFVGRTLHALLQDASRALEEWSRPR